MKKMDFNITLNLILLIFYSAIYDCAWDFRRKIYSSRLKGKHHLFMFYTRIVAIFNSQIEKLS